MLKHIKTWYPKFLKMGEKISYKKFMPGIAWFFIVGILVFMPGKDVPEVDLFYIPQLDKLVHAGMFGGITLLFCFPYFKANLSLQHKLKQFTRIALAAIVWGLAVEFIQKYFVPSRSFELLDWAADTAGVLIGWWFSKKILTTKFAASSL